MVALIFLILLFLLFKADLNNNLIVSCIFVITAIILKN